MLQKLRRQFIWTNMLLVSLVLLAVLGVVTVTTLRQLEGESNAALSMALRFRDNNVSVFEFSRPEGNRHIGDQIMIPTFSVLVDLSGQVVQTNIPGNVTVTEDMIVEAITGVLASGTASGSLSALNLRYQATSEWGGIRIAFADRSWETSRLYQMLLNAMLVGAVALALFFVISLRLSRLALGPVEQAWEQQRRFVADASHELKTPLTVILANIGIVLSRPNDTVAQEGKWLGYIQEEAGRMKILVEDLLFLAKQDDHRQKQVLQVVDFSLLVTSCVLPFESVAYEQSVSLDSAVAPGCILQGDEGFLRRLVNILLDNAVKYADGGGSVLLTLNREKERIQLSVGNSGEPISPEHQAQIFQRFYRADSSRSRDSGGYGLGLSIAQSIVEAHSGTIAVTSSQEQGTVFTVTLPHHR